MQQKPQKESRTVALEVQKVHQIVAREQQNLAILKQLNRYKKTPHIVVFLQVERKTRFEHLFDESKPATNKHIWRNSLYKRYTQHSEKPP